MKPLKKLVKAIKIKSAVKKTSKKVKLSKSDPDYYSKIGSISAQARNISSKQFSDWAKKSHENRSKDSYRGGRPKKAVKKTK